MPASFHSPRAHSQTKNSSLNSPRSPARPKLDQQSADKLVDLHLEAQQQAHHRLVEGWAADSRRQLGSELPSMVESIQTNMLQDIDPEVRHLLNWSGLGDHPAVIRQFYKWSRELAARRRY